MLSQAISSVSSLASANTDVAKLRKHAQEFESILLGNWLERVEQTYAAAPDEDSDAASGTLSGLGTQALARALAQNNALGVARMLSNSLSASSSDASSVSKG